MLASDATVRLTEIFCSLQGESSWVGERTVFVRLTGCPLRCNYCDTAYAFHGGEIIQMADVLQRVKTHQADYVCVTGGEPLAQPNCHVLLKLLCDAGYHVSLETSGAMDISQVDGRVKRIVDLKTPSSGELEKNLYANLDRLNASDEIKFVIANRDDYEWASSAINRFDLTQKVQHVLFSPVFAINSDEASPDTLSPKVLGEWMLKDKCPARLQVQLHKMLWGDEPGH